MSEFVQIGQTALRDPVTGDFLPAVPLYVRADDRGMVAKTFDGDLKALLAGKMEQYRREMAEISKRGGET